MVTIRPFKAFRPSEERAKEIAALPYDVYNRKEASQVVKNNPGSFLAIDRAETSFDDSVDTYAPEVYKKAHDLLAQWIDEKRFIQDGEPCFYVYREIMDGRAQCGLVALSSVEDYENGIIKKHENTRADKEQDRINHVDICNAQTGPIFLAYKPSKAVKDIITKVMKSAPVYDFMTDDDKTTQTVWVINEEADITALVEAFSAMDATYIADGHHRAASAVRVAQRRREADKAAGKFTGNEEYLSFLSVLFSQDELAIMDYNRVVKDLNGLSNDDFVAKVEVLCKKLSSDKAPIHPTKKGEFSMYLDGEWTLYAYDESIQTKDPVKGLDVSIMQDQILGPILGIGDPKTDKRIDFVGGIRGLEELERRCSSDCKVAFAMYPTSMDELFNVADARLLMPPKSTWFEPKLRSGLFIHSLED